MDDTEFQVGELIENRYRVLSITRTGGMGTLYHACDEFKEGEIVGFKTVRLNASGTEALESTERFQNEFQILTQLHHPNLVSVYDFGNTIGGELYFTMEWVEGQDLEPAHRSFEIADSIPLMVQICRALAYLHARGVIHGDLKPSNILMSGDQVKIVDFGLALESDSADTRSQYYTPGYSAPEIRQQGSIDHRIDLYSLGAIWYALLVGEPPMFMSGAEYLVQLTLDELLEAQDQVPVEISAVIARLLASDPMDRYSSANEVIEAVNRSMDSTYALETRETAGSYALRGRFVGRRTEMQRLQTLWQQAQTEGGKLVLVSGESGVGKTRLVEEFVVRAELEGARVARGQCVESGGSAYRPWREVLRLLIRYLEDAPESDLDMARVGPILATLLPELWQRDYMADLAPAAELELQAAQQRLNDTIIQTLRASAGLRATVIVIEDAQWADKATLELLQLLARVPGRAGLLVCITHRDENDPAHSLKNIAGSRVERISINALSSEITTDLVCSMLGLEQLPASLMNRVQQMTAGNAFFIKELIRSLAEDGVVLQRTVEGWHVDHKALQQARLPDSIRQVVRHRLEHLSAEAQQTLQWASIIGAVFWDGAVQEIGQISKSQMQVALGEGLEKELIFERDTSAFKGQREFIFAKPAVQDLNYENVSEEERQAQHSRVAAWLIAHSDEQESEHLGLIANHLDKADQQEQAITYLCRAGEQAAAQYANVEAIAYFSRALDLTPENDEARQYDLLLTREKVYDLQGNREAQAQDLAILEAIAEALNDDRRRVETALRRASYANSIGDFPMSIAVANTAIKLAQAAEDANGEAAGYLQSGNTLWVQGEYGAAQHQLSQGLALARAKKLQQVESQSLMFLGTVSWYRGSYDKSRIYCEQALHIEREMNNQHDEVWTLNMLGIVCAYIGDYVEGQRYFEEALRISHEIGYQRAKGTLLDSLGLLLHRSGDAEAARERSQEALYITQEIGDRRMEGYALTTLGHALTSLNRLTEAADVYQQALTLRKKLGQQNLIMETLAGLARVSLAQGDPAQALAQVEKILIHLQHHTLDGTEERFRIYLTCYHVLHANQDPRAQAILETTHNLLQEHAAKIEDKQLRRSFLENVPAHSKIVKAWETR